ncbi:MAG: hypothetical protein ACREL5_07040 [Gemmatimonadales bacterium]
MITREVAQHPAMQFPDLYKLILQATMGSEHAAADRAMATEWMHRELASLGSGPVEPLVDTLGRGGRYVRINLRPFVARGGNTDSLLEAFLETPSVAPPDSTAFRCAASAAESLARTDAIRLNPDSLRAYFAREIAAGYPAVDHSAAYEQRYHPAYRVVARRLVARVLRSEK